MAESEVFDDFVIYRPPLISSRLEPTYSAPRKNEWRPSMKYSHKLYEIEEQFTPAEYFRHRLKTDGKHIRLIQRLELRWNRRLDEFVAAATRIQALYRGNVGRAFVKSKIVELRYGMEKRKASAAAQEAYKDERYEEAIKHVESAPLPLEKNMLMIKIKSLFRLEKYDPCIIQCNLTKELLGSKAGDGPYYYELCSLSKLGKQKEALAVGKTAMSLCAHCEPDTFRVMGGIAFVVKPPEYDFAVECYSQLIQKNSKDFEALILRACSKLCLQEWSSALVDLNVVLAFQPVHKRALLFRARLFSCTREWGRAKRDYDLILYHNPGHVEASKGLMDIAQYEKDAKLDKESS